MVSDKKNRILRQTMVDYFKYHMGGGEVVWFIQIKLLNFIPVSRASRKSSE